MNVTINDVQVLKVSVRDGEPDSDGKITKFASVKIFDGNDTQNLWGFASGDNAVELPAEGSHVNIRAYVSAKKSSEGRVYLSVRFLGYEATATK